MMVLDFEETDIKIAVNSNKDLNSKDGIFNDMSNKKYHSIDGISSTQFQDLDLSIAIFENRHLFPYDCRAFADGNLNHTALLEPQFLDEYIETTTKTYESVATERLKEDNPDNIITSLGSIEIAKERALKVRLIFGKFLASAKVEISIIIYDEDTNMYHKCRPDIWLQDKGIILDYKTSKETTPNLFMNVIEKYNYHLSAAWYIDTVNKAIDKLNLNVPKVTQFGWIISPNYAPYKPFGLVCSDELIEKGRVKYSEHLNKLVEVRNGGQDELFKLATSWEYRQNN